MSRDFKAWGKLTFTCDCCEQEQFASETLDARETNRLLKGAGWWSYHMQVEGKGRKYRRDLCPDCLENPCTKCMPLSAA